MHWMRTILLLAVLSGVPACNESTPDSSSACRTTGEPLSLADTFHQLRACMAERSYRAMEPYIEETGRKQVIEMLIAVDELLAANEAALQAARQACPGIDVRPFDMSVLADNLDLFSRRVTCIACEESGNHGVVTASISDRLPLDRIEFIHEHGYWMYEPGPSWPAVTPAIREIAAALERIVFVISQKPHTPEEIRDEYRLRVSPKVRRIIAMVTTSAPDPQ